MSQYDYEEFFTMKSNMTQHEKMYRSDGVWRKMNGFQIAVCGAGALGSNLTNILVRQGFGCLTVIDMDRVESKNTSTQIYTLRDVGQKKVAALKSLMHQANKCMLKTIDKELRQNNASKLLKGKNLVVDVFDNWESRKIVKKTCANLNIPCVHAGMSDDGFAEVKWNDTYKIPDVETKQEDICDYPLAANLVHLTSAVLAEAIAQFISSGDKLDREITLKDIGIHRV